MLLALLKWILQMLVASNQLLIKGQGHNLGLSRYRLGIKGFSALRRFEPKPNGKYFSA